MAKLEELSELLVSEIRDFEKVVKRLEELHKSEIKIDTVELLKVLSSHKDALLKQELIIQKSNLILEVKLKKLKIFIIWLIISIVVSIGIYFAGILIFFFYLI